MQQNEKIKYKKFICVRINYACYVCDYKGTHQGYLIKYKKSVPEGVKYV